jgi:hypothetical protein
MNIASFLFNQGRKAGGGGGRRRRHLDSQMRFFSSPKYKKRADDALWKYARTNRLSQ